MCHINLILRKDMKPLKALSNYMNVASYYSFLSNDDGEGYFGMVNKKDIHFGRKEDKFVFNDKYWLLATHQRLTTSGEGFRNTHPHETKDFILMHNGVISSLGNKHKSDSKIFAEMLQKENDELNDLPKAICSLTKKISGSYSILIIEKASGRLLYFKENSTRMHILQDDDWIIMSTSYNNVSFGRFSLNLKENIVSVEPLIIYDVLAGMKKICGFEEKKCEYGSAWWEGYNKQHSSKKYFAYGFKDTEIETEVVVKKEDFPEEIIADVWVKDDR